MAPGRNYGGILQQYALLKSLEALGHEAVVLRREPNDGCLKRTVRGLLEGLGLRRRSSARKDEPAIREFVEKELPFSAPVVSGAQFRRLCRRESLDALVYGSDQIWRRAFALRYGFDYFGASTPESVRQIAYAPSFGLDEWQFTAAETARLRRLLSRFAAVSSREQSGVRLIGDNLGIAAELVCDPTLLPGADFYDRLAGPARRTGEYCFVYWLGDTASMDGAVSVFREGHPGFEVVAVNLRERRPLPGIGEWLALIRDAGYVITDSFHGTVFSLLFSRQFEVHCNKSGGYDRILTLLGQIGLEDKLGDMTLPVDYPSIAAGLEQYRSRSLDFLKKALSE